MRRASVTPSPAADAADETRDDPTTVRNIARSRSLGYAGIVQANLYSFRTPSPRALKAAGYPGFVGGDDGNYEAWRRLLEACDDVVLAWGNHAHGGYVDRDRAVWCLREIQGSRPKRLLHLGLTKTSQPRHPLMTAYAVPLQEWA